MRGVWAMLVVLLLAGCAGGLPERQAELTQWVGQPEAALIGAMGAPHRVYEAGGMTFLTYQDVQVEDEPNGPFYFGPGPAGPPGFIGTRYEGVCDTTFTVSGGVVRAFSLRGGGCGW